MAAFRRVRLVAAILACGGGGSADDQPVPSTFGTSSSSSGSEDESSDETTGDEPSSESEAEAGSSSSGGASDCTFCDAPNQACIDDMCVTTCQGQVPDPCGPAEVCDVMSDECRAPDAACTLAGDYVECGESHCGPGSVRDDEGSCLPYPPCSEVACVDGNCWGTFCSCERSIDCEPPALADLNGPFAGAMSDLAFADDCTAWMVTFQSGTDYLRRLTPEGEVTVWAGVSNLNMGEVAVLKTLTPPPGIAIEPGLTTQPEPPTTIEGIGEVAIHVFDARITATAPLTSSHLLIALIGGTIVRYNVVDDSAVVVAELMQDVTSLAFDAFDGVVYASLRNLDVQALHPFTGEHESFATMPARGRVTVSPNGQLWYAPLGNAPDLSAWALPTAF